VPHDGSPTATIRGPLSDDTLLVFISDVHIGGAGGTEVFDSEAELTASLGEWDRHEGPVELVLAGDFFDLLRMEAPGAEDDRIESTIARPDYQELFDALRRFARGPRRRVTYVVGNHDAEAWWNQRIRRELVDEGLVHEVALSFAATFAGAPDQVVYCEHGNQLDPANRITDYANPLESPLGTHVVTDFVRPLGSGASLTESLHLRDVNYVFPVGEIPEWMAGRIFYQFVSQALRWLLTPLLIAFVLIFVLTSRADGETLGVRRVLVVVAYDLALLVVALGVLFFLSRRVAKQAIAIMAATPFGRAVGAGRRPNDEIRELLTDGRSPPMASNVSGANIAVWVSGHSHAPGSAEVQHADGLRAVIVNTGCWLRQLQPVEAHFGAPPVFVPAYVQTHVLVRCEDGGLTVELWDQPRPIERRLRWIDPLRIVPKRPKPADPRIPWIERAAIIGRLPEQPPPGEPLLVARHRVSDRSTR
jgi:predicted phosphodiesterase